MHLQKKKKNWETDKGVRRNGTLELVLELWSDLCVFVSFIHGFVHMHMCTCACMWRSEVVADICLLSHSPPYF